MNHKLRRVFMAALIALLAFGFWACRPKVEQVNDQPGVKELAPGNHLQVYAIDVGQGDSLLIISPQGKTVLIDAGPVSAGDEVVAALKNHNVSQLDLVVATHPHADHIGGMKKVLTNVTVKKFLDSGQTYTSATYEKMLTEIQNQKIGFIKAKRGQNIELEPGVNLAVLNPGPDFLTKVRKGGSIENANSVVVRLSYNDFAMMFTGDAEFETEAEIMDTGAKINAQVLKIGHHGSQYATSGKFLETVNPQVAVISDGATNDFGHPTQSTLDRLRQKNIQTYRTDLNGEVAILSDGKNFVVKPARQADQSQIWTGRQSSHSAPMSNP